MKPGKRLLKTSVTVKFECLDASEYNGAFGDKGNQEQDLKQK